MQLLIFLLVYPILWLVSIMPFRLMYLFSDFVYILVYSVFGYRRKVVRDNLTMAFPEYSEKQLINIEKKFYHHLCDMFLEMIKTMSLSKAEMRKRFQFTNADMYLDLEKKGKSIALMGAHYASYEWMISMDQFVTFKGYAIYKKIANVHFDKLVRDIRSNFNANLITTKETVPTIQYNQANKILAVYGFASDQSPKVSKIYHWGTFMGIDTPIITGAEMLAKRFDMNMIFLRVRKIKRGYYEATFANPIENASEVPNYDISDAFMANVETQIREAPEFYLWTHKRWKAKKSTDQTTD